MASPEWMPKSSERDYLHLSQWVTVAGCARRIRPAQDTLQPLEAPPLTHSTNVLPGNGSEKGMFARMLLELADRGGDSETLMIPSRDITA